MSQKAGESVATEGRGGTPPERWSAQRKMEVVLRLLRGEDLGEVSREIQVAPPELEEWRRVFLESGQQGLKKRSRDPTERELIRTRAKPRSGGRRPGGRTPSSWRRSGWCFRRVTSWARGTAKCGHA